MFKLTFFQDGGVELGRIELEHPLLSEPRRAVRGRTSGAFAGWSSFPWGQSSKALAVLLLRAKLLGAGRAQLEGNAGSLAAALDYALSKPPVWMQELFGDRRRAKRQLLRSMVSRTNPERKRPGPVVLAIHPHRLEERQIEVSLDGKELRERAAIAALLHRLESDLGEPKTELGIERPLRPKASPSSMEEHAPAVVTDSFMQSIYRSEIHTALADTPAFSESRMRDYLESLAKNPALSRVIGNPEKLLGPIRDSLSDETRLGSAPEAFLERELKRPDPVRIWTTAVQPACFALIRYLIDVKGYNIDLTYRFPYGTDLRRRAVDPGGPPPHVCVLGHGPSAELLKASGSEYVPWMLGPMLSHAIVSHHRSAPHEVARGDYFFVTEDATTAWFCFDDLTRSGRINRSQVSTHHCEPDEVMTRYQNADRSFRALLWFPHYHIHEQLNGARLVRRHESRAFSQPTFFLIHKELLSHRNRALALKIALRDAWLTLCERQTVREQVLSSIASNAEYMSYVLRCAGMHNAAAH